MFQNITAKIYKQDFQKLVALKRCMTRTVHNSFHGAPCA